MPDQPAAWRPILDGPAEARAREIVLQIARDLPQPEQLDDPTLSSGHAGFALVYAYLAESLAIGGASERAKAHLDRAIELTGQTPMKPRMPGGFVGVAWVVEHVGQLIRRWSVGQLDPDSAEFSDDTNDDVDAVLRLHVSQRVPCDGRLDYAKGVVGVAAYALERSTATTDEILTRALDLFAGIALRGPEGTTWAMLPPSVEASVHGLASGSYASDAGADRSRVNLGMLHGVAGVISILAQAAHRPLARDLLRDAVRWLIAQALPADPAGRFPCYAPPLDGRPARNAWCYGDAGIAVALLAAARALDDRNVEDQALATLLALAVRDPAQTGAADACLCHGSAGLAHLLNRCYQATGDARLGDAARNWFDITMAHHAPGTGVGGFEFLFPDSHARELPHAVWRGGDTGLAWGAGGVALALLASISHIPPDWDRSLLVFLPPGFRT